MIQVFLISVPILIGHKIQILEIINFLYHLLLSILINLYIHVPYYHAMKININIFSGFDVIIFEDHSYFLRYKINMQTNKV